MSGNYPDGVNQSDIDRAHDGDEPEFETCEYCDGRLDDDGVCKTCEARFLEERDHFRALYEGEKQAGLHGEFTEEGLEMRRREKYGRT